MQKKLHCSDLEAAQKATELRESCVERLQDFTFETVLSTRRNLDLLIKAKEKVISRYYKPLELLPELISISDVCHIYDNTLPEAFRIFKKRKNEYFFWENELYSKKELKN